MRNPASSWSFPILSGALYIGLSLCPVASAQAQSQACTPGNTTASMANSASANPNSLEGAADNTKTAFKNLGSVFSKKKDSTPSSTASAKPCPPAATTASASAPSAAPASAAPAAAAAQPAASSSQGVAAPWSPDGAGAPQAAPKAGTTATAFTGTLDPAKLPDVVGIHVGMPAEDAVAILKKLHGGNVNVISAGSPVNYTRANYQLNVNPPAGDTFQLNYSFPPGVQRVTSISHQSQYYPQVSHSNMLDSLRAKYGKETLAIAGPLVAKPGEDARITQMDWLFDENGKAIPPGPVSNMAPYGCVQAYDGVNMSGLVNAAMQNRQPAPTYCDSLIILTVAFSNMETVGLAQTTIIDNGLLLRSVKTTGDYQTEQAKKQHDLQLQQANQAKPTL